MNFRIPGSRSRCSPLAAREPRDPPPRTAAVRARGDGTGEGYRSDAADWGSDVLALTLRNMDTLGKASSYAGQCSVSAPHKIACIDLLPSQPSGDDDSDVLKRRHDTRRARCCWASPQQKQHVSTGMTVRVPVLFISHKNQHNINNIRAAP